MEKLLRFDLRNVRLRDILPTVIRDEINFELSQFDDWHLRVMVGNKDPDIMRILRNQVRDADWVEQARDSSEGEMITEMIGREMARRGE